MSSITHSKMLWTKAVWRVFATHSLWWPEVEVFVVALGQKRGGLMYETGCIGFKHGTMLDDVSSDSWILTHIGGKMKHEVERKQSLETLALVEQRSIRSRV